MVEDAGYGEPTRKSRRELRRERERKKRQAGLLEVVVTLLVAFVLVFGFVRPFVVAAYKIPTESMVPTLEVGDRLLANKFIYRFTEPGRGDVIIFDSVEQYNDDTLVKRVAGVEGDEVRVQGGALFVDGETQNEPYLSQYPTDTSLPYGPETVPENHVFVLGDNRGNSGDSRVFGFVPVENVEGKAFVVFWPPTHFAVP